MLSPLLPPLSTPSLTAAVSPPAAPDLRTAKAARAFEAMALSALLQPMFEGLGKGGPFGGGAAEAMWRPLLVNEIARAIAEAGGLGIARMVLQQTGGTEGGRR